VPSDALSPTAPDRVASTSAPRRRRADLGFDLPVRVYNKTGNGVGRCIDSGLFETHDTAWVVAAMASEQTDFANRADDIAPTAFAQIGELLYNAWGNAAT
jgi:hypothetical protein